jgi:hypothetical protein
MKLGTRLALLLALLLGTSAVGCADELAPIVDVELEEDVAALELEPDTGALLPRTVVVNVATLLHSWPSKTGRLECGIPCGWAPL